MNDLGARYDALLLEPLQESRRVGAMRSHTELELQAHWFAGDFGREFTTVDGRAVRVAQFGVWNREAGPDFAEAAVSLDGAEPQRGCIELDPHARDWERHGHASNPAYENVLLHVFVEPGESAFFTRTAQHRAVPQVRLDLSTLPDAPAQPQPLAKPGLCVAPLQHLPEEKVREVLLGAAQSRLRRKAAALARLSAAHGPDEALFQALAATLGYQRNKLPFTLLAQRLPRKLLQRAPAAALLFGLSGFLPQTDLGAFPGETRSYLRGLWEEWWPRRSEFERLALAPELWKLGGQRPANHPQRRLAALAEIVRHWPTVRRLAKACEPGAIRRFFLTLSDEYWDFHYTVASKPAPRAMALVGESRITEMLANVFFPLALSADERRWTGFVNLPAGLSNRRVETAALRLFAEGPIARTLLKSTAMQQGLLQIYEDFCMRDVSDCQTCLFPQQVTRW